MRKMLITLAVILAGCGGSNAADTEAQSTGTTSDELELDDRASLGPFVSIPVSEIGASHIDPPASFEHSPSIGGDHYPFWQNCGFYSIELIEGAATHTMEHGAVWITYNQSLVSDADLATLEQLAADNGKLLISPYIQEDLLTASAWGVQQRDIPSVDSPFLSEFIDEWIDNPELAEAGVRCTGAAGIPPSDVRSLADGTQVPDEFQ